MALLSFYPFAYNASILVIGSSSLVEEILQNNPSCTVMNTENSSFSEAYYDYMVIIADTDTLQSLAAKIDKYSSLLKRTGILIMGFCNKFGTNILVGDLLGSDKKETGHFGKSEIEAIINNNGFKNVKPYSVIPNLAFPQFIIADGYEINENIAERYKPTYQTVETVIEDEKELFDYAVQQGSYFDYSNAFLIECSFEAPLSDVKYVTFSLERTENYQFCTVIRGNQVEKKPLFESGIVNIKSLDSNIKYLKEHGIKTVDGYIENNSYIMPFINAKTSDIYLKRLLETDKGEFIRQVDKFRELIYSSSEIMGLGPAGPVLKKGFVDFVPLNAFMSDNEFVIFDQEFCLDYYPANVILYRTLVILYENIPEEKQSVPISFFFDRYELNGFLPQIEKIEKSFVVGLHMNEFNPEKDNFFSADSRLIKENVDSFVRNNPFKRAVDTCFDNIDNKKLFLFGAGKYAKDFILKYRNRYDIVRILDNDSKKWGSSLEGIPIDSPESLVGTQFGYKVIVCMKDFKTAYMQLKRMQVLYIGIYSPTKRPKIGYLSGVFDLYHIGHINMFKRAKEQCDYLIVGVTSDEYVVNKKKRTPFIPCDERIAVVQSCKYVDEVVKIPYMHEEITEAWEKYHYDVQFCGSDYEKDPWWLAQKAWLQTRGSDLIFFPYTQQTSSTKIKTLIDKKLV